MPTTTTIEETVLKRVMPHSIEAEQCVLGCALIDQDASYNIMSTLKENDFYSETHKIIFSSMYKVLHRIPLCIHHRQPHTPSYNTRSFDYGSP